MKPVVPTLLVLAVSVCAALDQNIPIVKYESEGVHPDGSYKWSYETGNGIVAQEEAHPNTPEHLGAKGSYMYTSPEGVPVFIVYSADENGFTAQGDSIPQPPPVPEPIQRALAWNAAHPEEEKTKRPIAIAPFSAPVSPINKPSEISKAALTSLQKG